MKLEKFADIVGIDLEMTYYANQENRFCIKFKDTAVKQKGVLCYTSGNGNSYESAVKDYVKKIRGETIVTNAYGETRKEFNVPKDLDL